MWSRLKDPRSELRGISNPRAWSPARQPAVLWSRGDLAVGSHPASRPSRSKLRGIGPKWNNFWTGPLLVFACLAAAHAELQVGDKFPPLDATTLADGTPPTTAGQVTLVDFWASWCAPCKASFPVYAQLQTDYQSRGLVIVAVSVDENQAPFAAFVRQQAPPFATLRDRTHQLVSQVKVPVMPTCYLLGRDGRVRFVHAGFHGAKTDQEIRRELDLLIAEPLPSP